MLSQHTNDSWRLTVSLHYTWMHLPNQLGKGKCFRFVDTTYVWLYRINHQFSCQQAHANRDTPDRHFAQTIKFNHFEQESIAYQFSTFWRYPFSQQYYTLCNTTKYRLFEANLKVFPTSCEFYLRYTAGMK